MVERGTHDRVPRAPRGDLVSDGRLLVVGGLTLDVGTGGLFPSPATDAEIYDPVANHWSTTAPMGFYRLGQAATRLADGRVLIAGGSGDAGIVKSTEIYNAAADRWISAAPMAVARSWHVATLLPDGDVFVAGGTGEQPNFLPITLSSGEIYDPRTNLWVTVASMADIDVVNTATLLRNGTVLVAGTGQSQAQLYDPARNAWSGTGPSMGGDQGTLTLLADSRVVLVGGYGSESFASVLMYDPKAVAQVARGGLDPLLIAAVLLAGLLLIAGFALSIPTVRRRLKALRPQGRSDEWIT